MPHDNEDREYASLSRHAFGVLGVALALLVIGGVITMFHDDSNDWRIVLLPFSAAVLMFYAAIKLTELRTMAYPRHHREVNQRSYRFTLLAFSLVTCIGARTVSQLSLPLTSHAVITLITPVLYYVMTPVMFLVGHKRERGSELVCDDELTQALRARALRFGYVAALIVLVGTYIAAVLNPTALLPVVAWGLAAAEIIPIAIYVALDWLSERGETL